MRRPVLTLAIAVALGCASEPTPDGPTFSVRDSAGVTVVTNSQPRWTDRGAWRVAPRPRTSIGSLDGPAETTFGRVRDVGRLPDGQLFVADEQASLIRFFSRDGDYVGSVGGQGGGPGDLNNFMDVSPYRGDSLWVYDHGTSRVSIFDLEQRFVRSFPNPLDPLSNYWVTSTLADGRFLLLSPGAVRRRDVPEGRYQDTTFIVLLDETGARADTIGRVPTDTRVIGPDGRSIPRHFSVTTGIVGVGERVVVLDPVTHLLHVYDLSGNLQRIFSRPFEPQPLSDEIRRAYGDAYAEWLVGNSESPSARVERDLRDGIYPTHVPASSSTVLVDELGYTWVGRYHFPGTKPSMWEVFDPDGVWLGAVGTPDQLEVKQIRNDEIIGIWTGNHDVQYLRSYALDRR